MDNSPDASVYVKGRSSPSLGLIRHSGLLRKLLFNPHREFTIRELALESGTAYATAWRVVQLLRDLGALRERKVGASRAISLNRGSPLVSSMRQLLALDLDPRREAARRFVRMAAAAPGVQRVILFGSVSRGTARPSSDVDLAVVVSRRSNEILAAIDRAAARVQDQTGLKVVPIPISLRDLAGNTALSRDLRAGEVLYRRR